MFSRAFFSNRFKCLRLAHSLSSSQCAYFLHFKSKGSIANLESGNFSPQVDNLAAISSLFAVSLDWLIGSTNTPYTADSMKSIEDYIWSTISLNMNPFMSEYLEHMCISNEYKQLDQRERYPLPVRANIVFLTSLLFTISEEMLSMLDKIKNIKNEVKRTLKNKELTIDELTPTHEELKTLIDAYDLSARKKGTASKTKKTALINEVLELFFERTEPIAYTQKITKSDDYLSVVELINHLMNDADTRILFDISKQPIKLREYGRVEQ